MIRHIVLFRFKKDVPTEYREGLVADLNGLKDKIPVVRSLEIGIDIGRKENSYDIALNSTFDSFDAIEEYSVHPEHIKVVEKIKELCDQTCKVDYKF